MREVVDLDFKSFVAQVGIEPFTPAQEAILLALPRATVFRPSGRSIAKRASLDAFEAAATRAGLTVMRVEP